MPLPDRPSSSIPDLLVRWDLELEGAAWTTESSQLARVRRQVDGRPAILKVPLVEEEVVGCRVLSWWRGEGAAHVLAIDDGGPVLIERAEPGAPLRAAAISASAPDWSSDDRATRTLVEVARRLHRHDPASAPAGPVPLRRWFRELFSWAEEAGGYFRRAAAVADDLLDHPRGHVVLHGDIHHENVLWFGPGRGWLAIDPKGLVGDPAFDYVNILTNPTAEVMLRPGRLGHQVDLIAAATGIERHRLLRWVVAWAGLSAAWYRQPHLTGHAADVVAVGEIAEWALARN